VNIVYNVVTISTSAIVFQMVGLAACGKALLVCQFTCRATSGRGLYAYIPACQQVWLEIVVVSGTHQVSRVLKCFSEIRLARLLAGPMQRERERGSSHSDAQPAERYDCLLQPLPG